jgi:DNA topoisomerase-3
LYHAAKSRSCADWIVGINASQALSIAAGEGIYSLGRVQTPTLALICKRFLAHKNFTVQKYYQLQLEHRKDFMDFKTLSKTKWEDEKQAEAALTSVQRAGIAVIEDVQVKNITEQPPLLFDLTGLQKQANKQFGFSAEETLHIAQSLYEKQLITYPRTGSKYIAQDMWAEIPDLIRALDDTEKFKPAASKLQWGKFNKRIVNDVKVTDHHGLLVTGLIPQGLVAKENVVYELIAYRLIEALSEPCVKEITGAAMQVLHYDFTLKGGKILEPGWRIIKGSFYDDESELLPELPPLKAGDELKIKTAAIVEKKTKVSLLYSEAGLLSAMENAGKEIENEQERKALQNIGIGTPATRAAIIETLFTRGYIQRENKTLLPTEKGLQVYELVKDKKIADVAMTARWEIALQQIENNERDADVFQKEMEDYAKNITDELLQTAVAKENLPELICPKCKQRPLILRSRLIKCSGEHCGWVQFRNICSVQLSIADIEQLVNTGKTNLIKGMKSKSGKTFNACIVLNNEGNTFFEFENNTQKKK